MGRITLGLMAREFTTAPPAVCFSLLAKEQKEKPFYLSFKRYAEPSSWPYINCLTLIKIKRSPTAFALRKRRMARFEEFKTKTASLNAINKASLIIGVSGVWGSWLGGGRSWWRMLNVQIPVVEFLGTSQQGCRISIISPDNIDFLLCKSGWIPRIKANWLIDL